MVVGLLGVERMDGGRAAGAGASAGQRRAQRRVGEPVGGAFLFAAEYLINRTARSDPRDNLFSLQWWWAFQVLNGWTAGEPRGRARARANGRVQRRVGDRVGGAFLFASAHFRASPGVGLSILCMRGAIWH
jgi:hypothetical protein